MALAHASSGDPIHLAPLGEHLSDAQTTALIKAEQLELVRVVLPAGKRLPAHAARGEITVHCIEGRIELSTAGRTQVLGAGDLVHLRRNESHALHALVDASALLTLCLSKPS